eukprot:jgi/Botrbrau1/23494/Bobra.106_1s0045.1
MNEKVTVVVTGATGQTGSLIVDKLLARSDDFIVRAVVRSPKSAEKLKLVKGIYPVDICGPDGFKKLKEAFTGADTVIIATSAVPQLIWWSIPGMLLRRLLGDRRAFPKFRFKQNQYPKEVDWEGQKVQIDAAKAAGVRKVVLVSSMGITNPDHFLNSIGDANILLWKRKAEEYLIASGLKYTILHPGGLKNEEGGKRQILMDVDDKFQELPLRLIPRADVAEVCVQSILLPESDNRSVDLVAKNPGDGEPTIDFGKLFRDCKGNASYKPLPEGKNV